jgi:hypothetical protein
VRLISQAEESAIGDMLEHSDPAIQKRGLQRLCSQLQEGRLLVNRALIEPRLMNLRWSADIKVRSWLYNTIARLRTRSFRDYLFHQIVFGETDAENITWAVAAFFSSALPDEVTQLLKQPALAFFDTALELAAQLYYDGPILGKIEQRPFERAVGYDAIFAKWYALLFGYDKVDRRIPEFTFPHVEYIGALTSHHDDDVAEYSIWSLFMSGTADRSAVQLRPAEVGTRNPHIRRWYYRLMAKSAPDVIANSDFFKSRIATERNVIAREGLAAGLGRNYVPELAADMLTWFMLEEDELVRLALAPHFAMYAAADPAYEELVAAVVSRSEDAPDLTSKVLIATAERVRPTTHLTQLLTEREVRMARRSRLVVNIRGAIDMSDNSKTVTNIAHGGNVNVGSINLGALENSSLDVISRIDTAGPQSAELKLALDKLVRELTTATEVSSDDKAVLHAVVRDIAEYQRVPQERGRTLLQKSIATLKGVGTTLPAAAAVAAEIHAVINAIVRLLAP